MLVIEHHPHRTLAQLVGRLAWHHSIISRNGASTNPGALQFIGAVLADQHDEWTIARHYLSDASMALLNKTCDNVDAHLVGELVEG